jgi:hypothetical protein
VDDLQRAKNDICRTLPKIAGVANGALVLQDKALANMELETFQLGTKSKVEGTIYLDQLFSENTLDFFIPFSSIMATTGNMGQMAYSAANCFMKAIVAQRRKRGLAGSVIDISRVVGVGYVERESKVQGRLTENQTERLITRSGTLPMSESDLEENLGIQGVFARAKRDDMEAFDDSDFPKEETTCLFSLNRSILPARCLGSTMKACR